MYLLLPALRLLQVLDGSLPGGVHLLSPSWVQRHVLLLVVPTSALLALATCSRRRRGKGGVRDGGRRGALGASRDFTLRGRGTGSFHTNPRLAKRHSPSPNSISGATSSSADARTHTPPLSLSTGKQIPLTLSLGGPSSPDAGLCRDGQLLLLQGCVPCQGLLGQGRGLGVQGMHPLQQHGHLGGGVGHTHTRSISTAAHVRQSVKALTSLLHPGAWTWRRA